MKKQELLKHLRYYQSCRRGADTEMPNPTELGKWIDSAITVIEKANTKDVNKILSNKEIVDKIKITKGAMILDGIEPEDNSIKLMNELIEEIEI